MQSDFDKLDEILAELLTETALKAAAPNVGDRLREMTAATTGGAKGIFEGFQNLLAELAGIPADLQNRLRNQWRRVDAAASHGTFGGLWDEVKAAVAGIVDKVQAAAAFISPATAEMLGKGSPTVSPELKRSVPRVAQTAEHRFSAKDFTVSIESPKRIRELPTAPSVPVAAASVPEPPVRQAIPWEQMTPFQRMVDVFQEMTRQGLITDADQAAQPPPKVLAEAVAAIAEPHRVRDEPQAAPTPPASSGPQSPEPVPWWVNYAAKNSQGQWVGKSPAEQSVPEPTPATESEPPRDEKPWWQSWMEKHRPQKTPPNQSPPAPREPGLFAKAASWFFDGSKDDQRYRRPPPVSRAVQTVGNIASPRLGAIAGGVAALGPHAAVAAATVATAAALVAMPKLLKDFGSALVESNRDLSKYNATIANAYARFDQADFLRKLDLASATSGSASTAANEWTKALDSLQGQLKGLASLFNLWSTGVAVMTRFAPQVISAMTGGIVDVSGLLAKIHQEIEKQNRRPDGEDDWGVKLSRAYQKQFLPGQNKAPAPLPPIGGAP